MFEALRASNFLDSEGVNTHIPYTDGEYVNVSQVASDLAYLNIYNVRDGISNGQAGSAPLSHYIALAQDGVDFTFYVSDGGALTGTFLASQLALIAQVETAVPGSVIAVEGANEVNNFVMTFNGTGGLQGAIELQETLYQDVHSDVALAGVGVDYFTGYGAGDIGLGPDPATVAGLGDYDTQHPYPQNGDAPADWVLPGNAVANEGSQIGPLVYTETGYSTNGGTLGAVNQDVQAKYDIDIFLDDFKNGVDRTYLYQLMDAYRPGSPQGDDGYGLFDPDGKPKASAIALHNLNSILSDSGSDASDFPTTDLNYTISGLSPVGDSLLLEKSDGTYDIAIWSEPKIWDEASGAEIATATSDVTLDLGGMFQNIAIFDPLASASALNTISNARFVTIGISDHPIIVEVSTPLSTSKVASASPVTAACYLADTLIATPTVAVKIQNLRPGDLVQTASGQARPVRWVGHRSYNGRFVCDNREVCPILIRAGALAADVPARDLMVSPRHGMFLNDALIPAELLVNGASVIQLQRVDEVSYYHVELDSHDILLAEGAPAESFIDHDSRMIFQNAAEFLLLHPVPAVMEDCAPRILDGEVLERVRRRIAARAGLTADHTEDASAEGPLDGRIDVLDEHEVSGWAFDVTRPHTPIHLNILHHGRVIATVVANRFRSDLKQAGLGDGRCAFAFLLDLPAVNLRAIAVRRVTDGASIPACSLPGARAA